MVFRGLPDVIVTDMLLNSWIPDVIVTDMGWALLNACLNVFNDCNLLEYLFECFNLIVNKTELSDKINFRPYICSTHLLKNIIDKTKKIGNLEQNIKNTFIFCFSLIQNSTNFQYINDLFVHIFFIFNSQKINENMLKSLNIINREIKKRDLETVDVNGTREPYLRERDEMFIELKREFLIKNTDFKGNIKKNSPFNDYFLAKIQAYQAILKEQEKVFGYEQLNNNEFYCPKLFNILVDKLYILPLWSGLMLSKKIRETNNVNRLTNNPVENYFGFFKIYLLQKDYILHN